MHEKCNNYNNTKNNSATKKKKVSACRKFLLLFTSSLPYWPSPVNHFHHIRINTLPDSRQWDEVKYTPHCTAVEPIGSTSGHKRPCSTMSWAAGGAADLKLPTSCICTVHLQHRLFCCVLCAVLMQKSFTVQTAKKKKKRKDKKNQIVSATRRDCVLSAHLRHAG